jgi:nitroreductase
MADSRREATRDYRSLSATPWKLWDAMYGRRSHRKYLPDTLPDGFAAELDDTIELSIRTRGARKGSVRAFTGEKLVERIRVGVQKGAMNKINFWVARTRPSGFLLMEVPSEDVSADRPEILPVASLVMEDAVLWLAEQGLGSCWLGGVSQKELSAIAGTEAGSTIPIATPFGTPVKKASDASDSRSRGELARRRKRLQAIAFLESMDVPYEPGDIDPRGFAAPEVQDVRGLLERINGVSGAPAGSGAPADLVIDACFEAGRVAPSAGNSQPWSFIAVRDPGKLAVLGKACGSDGWEMAMVVVAQASSLRSTLAEKPFWMTDGPIALSHISLMAASTGRAVAVFVNGVDERALMQTVRARDGNRAVGVAFIR